jgi:SAM-dependent methyltransferase
MLAPSGAGRPHLSTHPVIHWTQDDTTHSALWRSENATPPPGRVVIADDRLSADEAYGLACQGTALLWRGDFHNARQLLTALANRADRGMRRPKPTAAALLPSASPEAFHQYRQARAQRARTLGALLLVLDGDYRVEAPRAPDVRLACLDVYGPPQGPSVVSLRTLLGLIGAFEWRAKGIEIAALSARIHPHYGVFAPVRNEYVDLVAAAPLPALLASHSVAFDIGTGTGVLAAVLARRGIRRVIATDLDPRALACARENIGRLGLAAQVDIAEADFFPAGRAALVVCNPPWLPARPSSPLERGIYDPDSRMLQGFLKLLPGHLEPQGEGWLILSDLAELLGLRSRAELLAMFDSAHLKVLGREDIQPKHARAADQADPLYRARAAEVTSLWRLGREN